MTVDLRPTLLAKTENQRHYNAAIWQKIDAIERKHQMPRHVRELIPAGHPAREKADVIEALKAGLQ